MGFMTIKYIDKDRKFTTWFKNFEKMNLLQPRTLAKIGSQTRDRMRSVIKQSTKRFGATGNLANSIDYTVQRLGKGYTTVGIGNISTMESMAPYWGLINYGGFGSKIVGGYFEGGMPPRPGGREENWHWNLGSPMGTNNFVMQVRNPVRPMRYIERTMAWLRVSYRRLYVRNLNPEFRRMLGN